MFPLGSLPLSAIASMGGNDPRSLLKLASENPALVSGIAGQIARNPKAATDLATKVVGRAKMPKAPMVDMGYLMRQEKHRMLKQPFTALELARKSGITPMLGKF